MLCWQNGLVWTLDNLYGKLSVLYTNSRTYLLVCISKAFVLLGSLLSIAVSLEDLCPNFVIFSSIHAEWAYHEQHFLVHSLWEPSCTWIDSRAELQSIKMLGNAELYANERRVPANHCELKVITFYSQLDFATVYTVALLLYWFQMGFAQCTFSYAVGS